MAMRTLCVVLVLCILSIVQLCPAQKTAAQAQGWDDAWSMSNALVVKNYVDQLYYPHAVALLDAEKKLKSGTDPVEVVKTLRELPGIKGVVVHTDVPDGKGATVQWPDSLVNLDAFLSILLNSKASEMTKTLSPMTHRTVGGTVKFQQVPMGDSWLDLMVRYVPSETLPIPMAVISLVMDKNWLIKQIPAAMDSLYRENSQLLFCAASPTNKIWEQSLGVVTKTDTLWWTGRKDVKVLNVQPLSHFSGLDVYSYVHTLEKK
jgi:hypothetical protein